MTLEARSSEDRFWGLASILFMLVGAFGVGWGTDIGQRGPMFDERWITRPIAELIRAGWSVDTAIDFQETKGPALIWPYAFVGGLLVEDPAEVSTTAAPPGGRGGDMPAEIVWYSPEPGGADPAPPNMLMTLRLVSTLCFVLSVIPLLVVAWWCGIRGPPLMLAAVFFALLPHEVVFGQLVMGEASFMLLELLLVLVVAWGFGTGTRTAHRVAGPVLYGVVLAVMLHSRPHAAAWAAGVCLASSGRESWRSWPWWVASLIGGLLRLPLWARWGGLVSSDFQNLHGLGLRLESLTYLSAAMTLMLGVFLLAALLDPAWRSIRRWALVGGSIGLLLGIVAPVMPALPGDLDLTLQLDRYQGFAATLARSIAGEGAGSVVLAVLAACGAGGLASLLGQAFRQPARSTLGLLLRVQGWTLLAGVLMYTLTRGFVFDRYLLAWAAVLPIAWTVLLPKWLRIVQAALLTLVACWMVRTWLL